MSNDQEVSKFRHNVLCSVLMFVSLIFFGLKFVPQINISVLHFRILFRVLYSICLIEIDKILKHQLLLLLAHSANHSSTWARIRWFCFTNSCNHLHRNWWLSCHCGPSLTHSLNSSGKCLFYQCFVVVNLMYHWDYFAATRRLCWSVFVLWKRGGSVLRMLGCICGSLQLL